MAEERPLSDETLRGKLDDAEREVQAQREKLDQIRTVVGERNHEALMARLQGVFANREILVPRPREDAETAALTSCYAALHPLGQEGWTRVLKYLSERLKREEADAVERLGG